MNSELKVSVVVPVYNVEKYLKDCLNSILRQSHKNIELICIDDGSNDNSLSILEDFAAKDSRVCIIRQENKGAGAARNAGMDAAQGDYIVFLDSDDFFEPTLIKKSLCACLKKEADFCIYKSNQFLAKKNRYVRLLQPVDHSLLPKTSPFSFDDVKDNAFMAIIGWAWDKLFNLAFLQEHNLRYPELHNTEDLAFVYRAYIHAKRIVVINDVVAHQRIREGESLSASRDAHWGDSLESLKILKEELLKAGKYEASERNFVSYTLHFLLWNLNTLGDFAREELFAALKTRYFLDFGIPSMDKELFYSQYEYEQYERIMSMTYTEYLISEIHVRDKIIQDYQTSTLFQIGRRILAMVPRFMRDAIRPW